MKMEQYGDHVPFKSKPKLARECYKEAETLSFSISISHDNYSPIHTHPDFEFAYIYKGKTLNNLDGTPVVVEPGDYFLVNLGTRHQFVPLEDSDDFEIVNFIFKPEFVDPSLKNVKSFEEILNNYLIRFGNMKFNKCLMRNVYHDTDFAIHHLMERIVVEYENQSPGYVDVVRNLFRAILILMARNENAQSYSKVDDVAKAVINYVLENYMKPIHLSDICDNYHFSLSNASKIFFRSTGTNFRDYLQKVRIEKACIFLQNGDKNIAEIAELVGYTDPSFFHTAFKKTMNQTPNDYRRQYQKNLNDALKDS